MSCTTIVATDQDAERLLKYLVTYRKLAGSSGLLPRQKTPLEDNVSMSVIPMEEAVVAAEGTQRKVS